MNITDKDFDVDDSNHHRRSNEASTKQNAKSSLNQNFHHRVSLRKMNPFIFV